MTPDTPNGSPAPRTRLSLAILGVVTGAALAYHYGAYLIAGYFDCDFYQLLSEGFRRGQLALPLDGSRVAVFDVTPVSDRVYLYAGPLPAALYALVDAPFTALGFDAPPKLPLLLAATVAMQYGVYRLLLGPVGSRPVALLGSGVFALTYPVFPLLTNFEMWANELAIIYGAAFFSLGLWRFADLWRSDVRRPAIWAGALFGCALLCRATYFVWLPLLVGPLLLKRRLRGAVWWVVAIVSVCAVVQFGYNAGAFEGPFDFGRSRSYQGMWEDEVYDLGLAPDSAERRGARITAAASTWLGVPPHTDSDAATLYDVQDAAPQLLLYLNVLALALLAGILGWLRAPARHGLPLALLLALAGILGLYVLVHQSFSLRLLLDVWLVLWVLVIWALAGLARRYDASRPGGGRGRGVALGLVAVWLVTSFAGRGFGGDSRAPVSMRPATSQLAMAGDGQVCHGALRPTTPHQRLACDDPTAPLHPLQPAYTPQLEYSVIGLFRDERGTCHSLPYGGATLSLDAEHPCRIELELAHDSPTCATIELLIDAQRHGRLSEAASSAGRLCVAELPPLGLHQVRAAFHFTESAAERVSRNLRTESPTHEWLRVESLCE